MTDRGGRLIVPAAAISEKFVRSGGPGGQHVNKTSSAVQLRVDVAQIGGLTLAARQRLRRLAGERWSNDGEIVIDARRYRERERNRSDARERLMALLAAAAKEPKTRRKTRPSRRAVERRLDSKRRKSRIKDNRRSPVDD